LAVQAHEEYPASYLPIKAVLTEFFFIWSPRVDAVRLMQRASPPVKTLLSIPILYEYRELRRLDRVGEHSCIT
jgi:hypothetical protein